MSEDKIADLLDMRPLEDAKEEKEVQPLANTSNTDISLPAETNNLPTVAEVNANENLKDIELAKKNIETH